MPPIFTARPKEGGSEKPATVYGYQIFKKSGRKLQGKTKIGFVPGVVKQVTLVKKEKAKLCAAREDK